MKHRLATLAALAALTATPGLAESHATAEGMAEETAESAAMDTAEMAAPSGDAEAGADVFTKRCQTCHVVTNEAGETLAGRNGRTGPNLYNVAGHTAGTVEGFRYGKSLEEAGEQGLLWTEEHFLAYVADPRAFLREFTGDDKARSKMSYRLKDATAAADVFAFLVSLNGE